MNDNFEWWKGLRKTSVGGAMNHPFIIAEIGINHNGNVGTAKELIRMAKDCGCDAVKFQKRTVDVVYSKEEQAKYRESPWGTTNGAQKRGLEFTHAQYAQIDAYCRDLMIPWFISAWDDKSLAEMNNIFEFGIQKIASAMMTNIPFCKSVAEYGRMTLISTGMSTLNDIDRVVDLYEQMQCPYALMHCVSTYPCRDDECNLAMIPFLRDRYDCPVGYSGHESGILPSVLAVAQGAEYIERHITVDRTMYGSDQSASLEKRGLELLVRDCRSIRMMMGDGVKRVTVAEKEAARKLRYWEASIHA